MSFKNELSPFLHIFCDRSQAEELLKTQPDKTGLVRPSKQQGYPYCISFNSENTIKHCGLALQEHGYQLQNIDNLFPTFQDLLNKIDCTLLKASIQSPSPQIPQVKARHPPLYEVAEKGEEFLARQLLEQKVDVNQSSVEGCTPLFLAAKNGHERMVQLLLQNNAGINIPNSMAMTPLYVACEHGHRTIVEALCVSRANLNIKAENNLTPFMIATNNNHISVVNYLKETGAETAPKTTKQFVIRKNFLDENQNTANNNNNKNKTGPKNNDGCIDGPLLKLRRSKIFGNQWVVKWFILNQTELSWGDEKTSKKRKALLRKDIESVIRVDENAYEKKNCFSVLTAKKALVMVASSNEERDKWIDKFAPVSDCFSIRSN